MLEGTPFARVLYGTAKTGSHGRSMSISDDASPSGGGTVVTGTVSWFDLDKKFGFVALSDGSGDVFLHMSVLKEAGYVWIPRGTTMRVRLEDRGKRRVAEVLEVDTSTAQPGENEPILRKPKT
jgi:CspA family cold shock protein